jgi:hypothetical protein
VAAGGTPAAHLAFWLGRWWATLSPAWQLALTLPGPWLAWCRRLKSWWSYLFSHGSVPPDGLATAMAAAIYRVFMDTPPPPKVEAKWPWDWGVVWHRLWGSGLPPAMVDKMFQPSTMCCPLGAV